MSKLYTDAAMSAAIADVQNNKLSVRKAAKKYSVPKSSLSDRLTGKVQAGSNWGRRPLFSDQEEKEMIQCATDRAQMGMGFSKSNFFRYVGAMASIKNIRLKNGKPSDMWWRRVKSRNSSFSLRSPEPTGSIRHDAMSRQRIKRYFEQLGSVVLSPNFNEQPSRIWNMDETGITLSHKPSKVIAKKGAKTIHGKTSTSRELVTVIACGNAAGGYLPPHFIMPGKTRRKLEGYDLESATEQGSSLKGANFSVSDSGWTKDGIARLWFKDTFLKNIGPARPQLLICDGHGSHNNVEFLELAVANEIIIVELPSHTSHWTQPFDRTVFKSLKSHWNTCLDNFIKTTGIAVGHKQFLKQFNLAWQSTMLPSIVRNGFAATGIYPFNPQAIPDEAYAPNEMRTSNTSTVIVEQSEQMSDNTASNGVQTAVVEGNDATASTFESPMLGCKQHSIKEAEETDLLATNPQTMSCISLSVPLTTEDVLLPLVDDDLYGLVVDSSTSFSENRVLECSSREALDVIESTLSSEQKLRFHAALLSGSDTQLDNDTLFQSWKYYTTLVNDSTSILEVGKPSSGPYSPPMEYSPSTQTVANQILPISKPSKLEEGKLSSGPILLPLENSPSAQTVANKIFPIPKPAKKRRENEFFVLTADEIVKEKKRVVDMKKKQEEEKKNKRDERERKKNEKALLKSGKHEKGVKKRGVKVVPDVSITDIM